MAFNQINAPGYGVPATTLEIGNPYANGNTLGNPTLSFPNTNPDQYPIRTVCPFTANTTCYAPSTPFLTFDKDARPPRVFTWSAGLQREVTATW